MKSHTVPFENRWTNDEHAWQWHCELERLGVANVSPDRVLASCAIGG
jgi:hypothetical protein